MTKRRQTRPQPEVDVTSSDMGSARAPRIGERPTAAGAPVEIPNVEASFGQGHQEEVPDELLEELILDRVGAAATRLHRRPFEHWSSYQAEVVTAYLQTGSELRLFLKLYGSRRYPTEGMEDRQEREALVYRDVLPGTGLGTPAYFGMLRDQVDRCRALLIELVQGVPVKWCGFDQWVAAAGWLGRMQARFSGAPLLEDCAFLLKYEGDLFVATATAALDAVAATCPDSRDRLDGVVDLYLAHVPALESSATTLVHGGYRPQNIICAGGPPSRIAPVDWEEAGIGPAFYDLAYLADGFDAERRRVLVEAYQGGAASEGFRLPSGDEAQALLDWCSVSKTLGTLGKAAARRFPPRAVLELVGMAESAAARLAQR
jgi:Phosphotransferase enzyme family